MKEQKIAQFTFVTCLTKFTAFNVRYLSHKLCFPDGVTNFPKFRALAMVALSTGTNRVP